MSALFSSAQVVFGVRSGLRHPRRLTVLAIAGETPDAVFYVLRAGRAAAQAEDRRRLSPGRSRTGSPAAGGIG